MDAKVAGYTTDEVAQIFRVKPRTVRGWVRRGVVKALRDQVTRTIYITPEELERRRADLGEWRPCGVRPASLNVDCLEPAQGTEPAPIEEEEAMQDEQEQGTTTTTEAPAAVPAKKKAPAKAAPKKQAPPAREPEAEAGDEGEAESDLLDDLYG